MENSNRADFSVIGQDALKPLYMLGGYLRKSSVPANLRMMIEIRLSQINGCANCLDMHWKDARELGETEQRLYGLSVWRESPYYTEKERAALLWAEAVNGCDVPDEVYEEVAQQYTAEEMVELTMVVNSINVWNRLNLAFPKKNIGDYKPGQYAS